VEDPEQATILASFNAAPDRRIRDQLLENPALLSSSASPRYDMRGLPRSKMVVSSWLLCGKAAQPQCSALCRGSRPQNSATRLECGIPRVVGEAEGPTSQGSFGESYGDDALLDA
jgi:hypothetical protein